MKKILLLLLSCLIIAGCTKNNESDPNVHTFFDKGDLESFMRPLIENGTLQFDTDSTDNPYAKDAGIEYTSYKYNGGNWNLNYSEQIENNKKAYFLYLYDAPNNVTPNAILSLSTGDKLQESSLYVLDANGVELSLTMDRNADGAVGCMAVDSDGNTKECTPEQLIIGANEQAKMSTLLYEFLSTNNVDLTKTQLNFYDQVDISNITRDAVPAWTGENPIPDMLEIASTKNEYQGNTTETGSSFSYNDGTNIIFISYNESEDGKTLWFQATPIGSNQREIQVVSAAYTDVNSDYIPGIVDFSTENHKYSCQQIVGNIKNGLMCSFNDGDNFRTATDEETDKAKVAITTAQQVFTDLGSDFDTYFNLDNLK